MAKKKISPIGYRLGYLNNWNLETKLPFHSETSSLLQNIADYFEYSLKWHILPNQGVSVFFRKNITKNSQLKRFGYFQNSFLSFNNRYYLRRRSIQLCSTLYSKHSMFYPKGSRLLYLTSRLQNFTKTRSEALTSLPIGDRYDLLIERDIIRRRILFLYFFLEQQRKLPYSFKFFLSSANRSISGSIALRRYQSEMIGFNASSWYKTMVLHPRTFKKAVGFLRKVSTKGSSYVKFNHFTTNINLALHWGSSWLFTKILVNMLERRKWNSGFVRFLGASLSQLHYLRLPLNGICITISGSFGKITRTKVIRLGRTEIMWKKNITSFEQRISYSSLQAVTIRGVLGVNVWFFYSR